MSDDWGSMLVDKKLMCYLINFRKNINRSWFLKEKEKKAICLILTICYLRQDMFVSKRDIALSWEDD